MNTKNKKYLLSLKNKISLQIKRRYRFFSSQSRSLPDYLIIGTQKGGTSSLYSYLIQHPAIIPALDKELHFFDSPTNRLKGELWYRSNFSKISEKDNLAKKNQCNPLTGEASPSYIFSYHAPKFASKLIPNAKLILMLRDPVDRAFSHYQHNLRRKREDLSFEEAILKESERISNDMQMLVENENYESRFGNYAYLRRGYYSEQVKRWFEYFPKENFCFIDTEEFFANPQAQMNRVVEFLELPQFDFNVSEKHNVGNYNNKISTEMRNKLMDIYSHVNSDISTLTSRTYSWQ